MGDGRNKELLKKNLERRGWEIFLCVAFVQVINFFFPVVKGEIGLVVERN